MTRILLTIALAMMTISTHAAEITVETPAQRDARMKWWREARFGMFIHWGLYAIPAGDYNGRKGTEWIQQQAAIPVAEYEKLKDQFNPVKFDAKQWVKIAGDAGMKYLVITSKHHDGFCLWDSKVSEYDVMNTPFKRDILKELADACKADGRVRLCFYHSIMDWHHPDAQGGNEPGSYNPNNKYKPNPNFARYVDNYLKPQLKELITQYDPGVLWFDGEWIPEYTEAMGHDVYNFCKGLKADIIINNRVGKSRKGMAGMSASKESAGDFGTPEQEIPATGFPGVDWESCMTMNDSWGFRKDDAKWKSTKVLMTNLVDVVSKGGNYLLNVGPTAEGEIPAASFQRLAEISRWMSANSDSIHGASAGPFKKQTGFWKAAAKPEKLYIHMLNWSTATIPIRNKVTRAYYLASGAEVTINAGESGVVLPLAGTVPDALDTVIVLEIEGKPDVIEQRIRQAADGTLTLLAIDADIQGHKAKIEKKGANPWNIGYWTDAKDIAVWQATIDKPGKFSVDLEYSLAPNSKGSEIAIEFGDRKIAVRLEAGKDFLDFKTVNIGAIELPAGPMTITVRPIKKPGLAVMDLRQIVLKPK